MCVENQTAFYRDPVEKKLWRNTRSKTLSETFETRFQFETKKIVMYV